VREVTATGQSVEEAIQSALQQLNTTRDQVEVEIIDEGKKGFLGIFGSKLSIVSVRLKKNPIEEAEKFLKEVTQHMNIKVLVTSKVDGNHVTFEFKGEKIALLIGKRGQTLNALQFLTQLVINRLSDQYFHVMLDAEGYRERRKRTLEALALRVADRAKRLNKRISLEPMPAFERKIIHSALQDREYVTTYSNGTEPHRHIVIKP